MLKFFSLRGCINLVQLPASVNNLTCLQNLDLHDCFELMNLPLRQISMLSPYLRYLIFLDLGSSKIKVIPDAIGALKCLERLNLQGSRIQSLPETIKSLSCLAYLNLSGCHELVELHDLPFKSASSGGRYFKKVSEARNHRSGLYIFNCSRVMKCHWMLVAISWLARLVKEPGHFRCGFDIIVPFMGIEIPKWFFHHRFVGGSIIRILSIDTDVNDWLGFAFCVTFVVNKNSQANPGSSSKMPRPLYLSFESENTEECFDLPACLEMEKEHVGPISKYCWIIYISRAHCHFVKTGTCITFKACPGLQVKEWGLRMVCMEDIVLIRREFRKMDCEGYDPWFRRGIQEISDPIICLPHNCFYTTDEHENEGYNRFGPKIQLPYNWNVTDEEEKENMDAKAREINLYNLGHSSIEEEQVVNGHSSSEEEESMKMKGKALQVAFDEESDCSYMSDLSPR